MYAKSTRPSAKREVQKERSATFCNILVGILRISLRMLVLKTRRDMSYLSDPYFTDSFVGFSSIERLTRSMLSSERFGLLGFLLLQKYAVDVNFS